jgi:hypothetical protein
VNRGSAPGRCISQNRSTTALAEADDEIEGTDEPFFARAGDPENGTPRTTVRTTHETGFGRAQTGLPRSMARRNTLRHGLNGAQRAYKQMERSPTNRKVAGASPAERASKSLANDGVSSFRNVAHLTLTTYLTTYPCEKRLEKRPKASAWLCGMAWAQVFIVWPMREWPRALDAVCPRVLDAVSVLGSGPLETSFGDARSSSVSGTSTFLFPKGRSAKDKLQETLVTLTGTRLGLTT